MSQEASISSRLQTIIKTQPHLLMLGFFFFGALHYSESNIGGVGLEVPNNVVCWIIISLIIGAGLFVVARSGSLIYSRLTVWLLICICLLSIPTLLPGSNLINESPIHLGLMGGFLFFVAIQQFKPEEKDILPILFLVLCGALIESVYSWYTYLGVSISELSITGPGSEVPYGAIRQRNALASLYVTGLCISAYLLKHEYLFEVRNLSGKIIKTCVFVAPILFLPIIILLKSRTGWAGCALSLALIIPFIWNTANKKFPALWVVSLLIALSIVPIMEQFSDEVEVVAGAKLNLQGPRNYMYEQSLDLALAKPILGYGFGNFESRYNLFAAQGYADGQYESPGYENLSNPHNELLFWWIEGGILGLAGVLLAAFIVLRNIFKMGKTPEVILLLALFFPIVLHTQTEIPFLISISHWVIFLLLILVVDLRTEKLKAIKVEYYLLPAILSIGLPILVTLFMVTTLSSGRLLNRAEYDLNFDVSLLENISNPVVWQDRLLWDMNFGLLSLGYYQNRPELAANYIQWATTIIQRKPRAGYYLYLVIAYKMIGDEEKAAEIQKEAEFRFPNRDFTFDTSVFDNLESKNIPEIQANVIED